MFPAHTPRWDPRNPDPKPQKIETQQFPKEGFTQVRQIFRTNIGAEYLITVSIAKESGEPQLSLSYRKGANSSFGSGTKINLTSNHAIRSLASGVIPNFEPIEIEFTVPDSIGSSRTLMVSYNSSTGLDMGFKQVVIKPGTALDIRPRGPGDLGGDDATVRAIRYGFAGSATSVLGFDGGNGGGGNGGSDEGGDAGNDTGKQNQVISDSPESRELWWTTVHPNRVLTSVDIKERGGRYSLQLCVRGTRDDSAHLVAHIAVYSLTRDMLGVICVDNFTGDFSGTVPIPGGNIGFTITDNQFFGEPFFSSSSEEQEKQNTRQENIILYGEEADELWFRNRELTVESLDSPIFGPDLHVRLTTSEANIGKHRNVARICVYDDTGLLQGDDIIIDYFTGSFEGSIAVYEGKVHFSIEGNRFLKTPKIVGR